MIPHVISKNGGAPTVEEIQAANRVVSTRTLQNAGVYTLTDEMSGVLVEYHPFKNTAYTTPTGTDYVGVSMPNPVPHRNVSIYVKYKTRRNPGLTFTGSLLDWKFLYSDGSVALSGSGSEYCNPNEPYTFNGNPGFGVWHFSNRLIGYADYYGNVFTGDSWNVISGTQPGGSAIRIGYPYFQGSASSIGYNATRDAEQAAWNIWHQASVQNYIYTSNGINLLSVDKETVGIIDNDLLKFPSGNVSWSVPEDCIDVPVSTNPIPASWYKRRSDWLKKNSDEFIAALKTGFNTGSTRTELTHKHIPKSCEYLLKQKVRNVGKHTLRSIQYTEVNFTETIQSDTSANLTQAGVKVTQRAVTLRYQINVKRTGNTRLPDNWHTDANSYTTSNDKGNNLGLSQADVYLTGISRSTKVPPSRYHRLRQLNTYKTSQVRVSPLY